jgi:D-tyrosyl-tRNA(Tyr) deacylase
MRALIQRATKASVQVADKVAGQIDHGLLIRICSMDGDGESEVKKLAADMSRGNRPGFSKAAEPEDGRTLYEYFVAKLESSGILVENG